MYQLLSHTSVTALNSSFLLPAEWVVSADSNKFDEQPYGDSRQADISRCQSKYARPGKRKRATFIFI